MAFVSASQRKAVMRKLKQSGFRQTPKKISAEGQYFRARVEEPEKFQKGSFRTLDVGREGHIKTVIGRPIGKSTTATQSILVSKSDILKERKIRR